jgi:flagellar biosynthetic protein FliQ
MTPDLVVSLGKDTVWMVLKIGAPMLGFGLAVGLVVSILMSATQIQEITLTFVPKIVAVLLALLFFFPWIMRILLDFTENLFTNIPFYIR